MNICIEKNISNYIESLQYEIDRTEMIIAFMLANDYDIKTDAFVQWNKDNQIVYNKYREAKKNIERRYIDNNPELKNKYQNKYIKWELDFKTNELKITEVEQ